MATVLPSYEDGGAQLGMNALVSSWRNKTAWRQSLLDNASKAQHIARLWADIDPGVANYLLQQSARLAGGAAQFHDKRGLYYFGNNPVGGNYIMQEREAPKGKKLAWWERYSYQPANTFWSNY